MSLVTRCPRCRTLFRVAPNQLQARAGRVRCGRCMNAFDAYDALAAETTNILPAPRDAVAAEATAALKMDSRLRGNDDVGVRGSDGVGIRGIADVRLRGGDEVGVRGNSDVGNDGVRLRADDDLPPPAARVAVAGTAPTAPVPDPAPPKTAAPETALASHAVAEPALAAAAVAAAAPAPAEDEADERSRFGEIFARPTPQQRWRAGAAVLAVLLVLQLAYAYRSEIVARSPLLRSATNGLCEHLGCRVPLPQRPELVRIEASDVHMVDAARPQLIQLTATLRSYAGYDLAYPALDLVLTNANEHALARRIFTPDEYLDATRDPAAGIAANAEITVALDLDTGNLNAAGFRLDLLAAPPR
jgi:predicted Zn finger-like uncharacterized protein